MPSPLFREAVCPSRGRPNSGRWGHAEHNSHWAAYRKHGAPARPLRQRGRSQGRLRPRSGNHWRGRRGAASAAGLRYCARPLCPFWRRRRVQSHRPHPCPSKNHLSRAVTERAVAEARRAGALVVLDDAHMAARIALFDEPPALAFSAPDVAVWSLDKHVPGPRSGFVAGARDLIQRIQARALSLGIEAQLGQYIAGTHAVEAFDPEPIRAVARLSESVLKALGAAARRKRLPRRCWYRGRRRGFS